MNDKMNNMQCQSLSYQAKRYGADGTVVAAHASVATLWNGITIPRHSALPFATTTAHSTPSNCRL